MPNTDDGVIAMLRELRDCRAADAEFTVCKLTWNDDLWVSDGEEELIVADALASV